MKVLDAINETNKKLDRVIAILAANMETPETKKIRYEILRECHAICLGSAENE